jgi:hypothetical protein
MGRQVEEGRSQIDALLDHMNINAGNPVVCLTQVRDPTSCTLSNNAMHVMWRTLVRPRVVSYHSWVTPLEPSHP